MKLDEGLILSIYNSLYKHGKFAKSGQFVLHCTTDSDGPEFDLLLWQALRFGHENIAITID